jgi:maltodextrin utilization protein YvdJ
MFLVRYLKTSFQLKELIYRTKESSFKVFLYFILLSLISVFPMNYLIVREQGWRLDFIEQSFQKDIPSWDLPRDCRIELNRLFCDSDTETILVHDDITFIFNYQGGGYELKDKQIILGESEIIYTSNQAEMKGTYKGYTTAYRFNDINLLSGQEKDEAMIDFAERLENSFSNYIVFYSIMINTFVMIGTNIILVVLLSLVIQLFRFGYSTFFSYKEALNFVIFATGIPSFLNFFIGIIAPGISNVIYSMSLGIIVMVIMLVYGKRRFA